MNVIRFTDPRDATLWSVGDRLAGTGSGEIVTRIDHEHGEVHFQRATWWRRAWYGLRAWLRHAWWWLRCTWADAWQRVNFGVCAECGERAVPRLWLGVDYASHCPVCAPDLWRSR